MTSNRARNLRRNSTDAERFLRAALRRNALGVHFRRQHSIGPYVVDFVCIERNLIIEVDGSQHADSSTDQTRDAFLAREGFRVLRFWNNDVLSNRVGVIVRIVEALQA